MYRDTIDKDTLRPGDIVGVRIATRLGWGYFRYPKTVPMKIERITPARTKFVMTNGVEYNKSEPFYEITDKSKHETRVAKCAENISKALNEIDNLKRNSKLYSQDDDTIIALSELMDKAMEVLKCE